MQNKNTTENTKGNENIEDSLTSDDMEQSGAVYRKNLMKNRAEAQVRESEDASLQDDTYTFDSDNTGNEDIHDVTDFDADSYEASGEEDLQ